MINQMAAILDPPFLISGSSQNYVYLQEIERKTLPVKTWFPWWHRIQPTLNDHIQKFLK